MNNPYREIGCGFRRFYRKDVNGNNFYIHNYDELQEFIGDNAGKMDFAISLYFFTEKDGTPKERHNSAIFDCIFFDIDADSYESAKKDVQNLFNRWLLPHNIKAGIFFSGNRGFHVLIYFEEFVSAYKKKILRRVQKSISEQCCMRYTDERVFGDTSRLFRVPGTINTKSGLYCIPVSFRELVWQSEEYVKTLARGPRKMKEEETREELKKYNTDKMHALLREIEQEIHREAITFQRKLRSGEIKFPSFNNGEKPCIGVERALRGAKVGHRDDTMVGLIHYFRLSGMTREVTKQELLKWLNRCEGDTSEMDLDYKVDYHFDSKYSVCTFLGKISGVCNGCELKREMK